jgi:type I restriction enzyme S subunit
MPIINLTHIKSKNVVIPSKEVLKIYEEILISIYNKIFYNSVESRTLLIIRDSLLPKLMSGKIRVPLSNNMS